MSIDGHDRKADLDNDPVGLSAPQGGWRIKQRKAPVEDVKSELGLSTDNLQRDVQKIPIADRLKQYLPSMALTMPTALRTRAVRLSATLLLVMIAIGGGLILLLESDLNTAQTIEPSEPGQPIEGDAKDYASANPAIRNGHHKINAIALPALENEGFLPVYFRLTEPADEALNIDYQTVPHTASAETDFTAKTGTVTIQPGDISVELEIPLINDEEFESIETFRVILSTDQDLAYLTDQELMATVIDDDRDSSTRSN